MKKVIAILSVILLTSLKASFAQTVTVVNSKTPPEAINEKSLKTLGDSIKIIVDDYKVQTYIINKKDTVELGVYETLDYKIKPLFEIATKFTEVGKTKIISNGLFTMLCINTKSLSYCDFVYFDAFKSKRYHFLMNREKLKELSLQINTLLKDK